MIRNTFLMSVASLAFILSTALHASNATLELDVPEKVKADAKSVFATEDFKRNWNDPSPLSEDEKDRIIAIAVPFLLEQKQPDFNAFWTKTPDNLWCYDDRLCSALYRACDNLLSTAMTRIRAEIGADHQDAVRRATHLENIRALEEIQNHITTAWSLSFMGNPDEQPSIIASMGLKDFS